MCLANSMRSGNTEPPHIPQETLKIHGWWAKKNSWLCLFSFPEKLTFQGYMVPTDSVYLQITHHGIITVNASQPPAYEPL